MVCLKYKASLSAMIESMIADGDGFFSQLL